MTDAEAARKLIAVLREIDGMCQQSIHEYGITQQPPGPPEAWTTRINAVLKSVAPIRDKARKAIADAPQHLSQDSLVSR